MAKVSIVIPVYGVEKYLEQCLDSVINQTFSDIEIILIDDKSPDRCPVICENYAKKDGRIKVVHHSENKGLRSAVLTGLKNVTSKFVVFIDSDDWAKEDLVETLYNTIIKTNTDCVSVGYTEHFEDRQNPVLRTIEKVFSKQEIEQELLEPFYRDIETISKTFGGSRWGKIYKRDILQKAAQGINPKLYMGEDLDSNIRFLTICESVATLSGYVGYYYRCEREGSTTNRYNGNFFAQNMLMISELEKFGKSCGRDISRISKQNDTTHMFHEIEKCLKSASSTIGKIEFINAMLSTVSEQQLLENCSHEMMLILNSALDQNEKINFLNNVLERITKTKLLTQKQKDSCFIEILFCVIKSRLSDRFKKDRLKEIKQRLDDRSNILKFAKNQPFFGKVSCLLVYIGLEELLIFLHKKV